MGMARTFQNIRLWKYQTVFDNVLIAKHCRSTSNLFSATFRLNRKEEAAAAPARWRSCWRIVGLADVKDEKANSLPYGKQRRLEIARALATDPKLLLLDEPAAGMNPQETDELTAFIGEIREQVRPDHLLDRAPHGPGHGHFRPHLCAGLRQADRRRHAGGDPEQSARH